MTLIHSKWQPIHGLTSTNLMSLICRSSVYNTMDETSKWYNMRPTHSSNVRGYKQSKECLIVAVCGNADGSHKFGVYGIGTAKKPRTFPNEWTPKVLGIAWANKKTACVTTIIPISIFLSLHSCLYSRIFLSCTWGIHVEVIVTAAPWHHTTPRGQQQCWPRRLLWCLGAAVTMNSTLSLWQLYFCH